MSDEDLAKRKCKVCTADTPTMHKDEASGFLSRVDQGWELAGDDHIRRSFDFKNFRDAFGFVTRVALLAEDQGHHPDLEVGWGNAVVSFTTHAAGGLTENDFIMAAKVDRLTS